MATWLRWWLVAGVGSTAATSPLPFSRGTNAVLTIEADHSYTFSMDSIKLKSAAPMGRAGAVVASRNGTHPVAGEWEGVAIGEPGG